MRQNPERMAWTVLLSAFVVFCLLAVGVPLLTRSYLVHATQPLHSWVSAQRGTVRVERSGSNRADAASLDDLAPLEVFKGDGIRTSQLDEGLLRFERGSDEDQETLTSVVIYDNSDVVLTDAFSPRFGLSSGPHRALLHMNDGRARIDVNPSSDGRPVNVEVHTQHANIELGEGSYALDVTSQQTVATVRQGTAIVYSAGEQLELSDEQRAVVASSGELGGPLPAGRNLIVNGDFSDGIDAGWVVITNSSDDSARVVGETDNDGQPVANFQHEQAQPSEIGLLQTLNRNVKDLESLILHLKVRVDFHSLPVCGSLGSECPVMVRIDYRDAAGNPQQWVKGFYAFEDPAITQPYYCTTCPDPSSGNHDKVAEQTWFLYDSPNLMEVLPPERRPAFIQSVRVYASGHSYDSMVTDVELLAQE
jgi:hypothetical protein